ncbi:MAG: histidine phosphatase family protein [Campylobacterota bacterium]|nr:histidine phosphatase family protein [Campylobacterota bacterium]
MKKLYLVRHAKSSWKDITLDDFDRPLNKRGKKDAPFMAKLIKEQRIIPDILISSPANRAKTTAQTFHKILNLKKNILFDKKLYFASLEEIEDTVTHIDDKYDTVFIFSHNPTLNEFIEKHLEIYDNLPTCGIAGMVCETNSWKTFLKHNLELIMFDYPKNHKDGQ